MTPRTWIVAGCLFAAVGVALGAFGAHGLEEQLTESGHFENWRTAVRYQMWHALALVLLGLFELHGRRPTRWTGVTFSLGIVCFSGSLYALGLGVPSSAIWFVTPLGGLLLLVGWVWFLLSALRADLPSAGGAV